MSEGAFCRLCNPPAPVDAAELFTHLRLFHPGWDEGGEPVTDVSAPFEHPVMTAADLEPHGALCSNCGTEFRAGDPYATLPEGFAGDVPITVVVCLKCAGQSDS